MNSYILSFDLSSTCTGVAIAELRKNKLVSLDTLAIKPPALDPRTLGFLPKKGKGKLRDGTLITSYLTSKNEVLSKAEKKKRDFIVKSASEKARLEYTILRLKKLIDHFTPFIIIMEANMAFRSMEVTRILAEVAGALQALAATLNIRLVKLNVHVVRGKWDLYGETKKFVKTITPAQAAKMDLTKEVLKHLMLNKYARFNLRGNMTTDESDALVLLDYWLNF